MMRVPQNSLRFPLILLTILSCLPFAWAMPDDSLFQTTPVMRDETRDLVKYLERVHYAGTPVQDIAPNELMKSYMGDLDFQRLFFLASDLKEFNLRFSGMMDIYLRQGTIMPAFEIFKVYRERSLARFDWIFNRLEGDFDFLGEDTYAPDRSKAEWPKSPEHADVLWERRLKYELIIEMLDPSGAVDAVDAVESSDSEAYLEKSDPSSTPNTEQKQGLEGDLPNADGAAKADSTESKVVTVEEALENLDTAKATVRKRYEQMKRNVTQIEPTEVQEMFLTSLTRMYDPHSTFLSADSLEDFAIAIKNSLVGIGAVLSIDDGYCTIRELIPGGPADMSNILSPKDRIIGVAQDSEKMVDVVGMKLRKIVKLIRGNEGTRVRLLVQPTGADPSERKEITLVRDKIKLTASLAQAEVFQVPEGDETYTVGVIQLPAFYGAGDNQGNSTTSDVAELLNKLKGLGAKGIILDLRNNGGGLLSEAVSLAGLFIPQGPVVQVKNTIGHIDQHSDVDGQVAWTGPLIVLVSRFSASASEIVTGALKNHRRALIVGDSATHGKGTVQAVFEMDRLSNTGFFNTRRGKSGAAKVTIQKWYLPNGNSTQIKGVASDIALPSPREFMPIGEGDLPRALMWDSIDALPSFDADALTQHGELKSVLIDPELVKTLARSSLERQQLLEEFNYWKTRVGWLEERNNQKDISLNLEKRITRRQQDKLFLDELDTVEKEFAQKDFISEEVLLNITLEKEEESRIAHNQTEEEAKKDKDKGFDIHLREALRIMANWLSEQARERNHQVAAKE